MILLDTDHVSVLNRPESGRGAKLFARPATVSTAAVHVSIVSVEEQMRGWLASIAKARQAVRQVSSYRELAGLFRYFDKFNIVLFDDAAADIMSILRPIQIGTMDKKIAAIALANGALLLTANRRDFEQVPGLNVANWVD